MTDQVRVRRALLSVSDKTDLIPFARALAARGVELISTGGTARALADADVPVTPVESVTGFPEMMDGRVKTLHPAVHGALLGRRDEPSHVSSMQEHGIDPIDLICVNLYPFERTIAEPDVSHASAVEQIDIGGPAMLRSAAKNHDFVAVVTDAGQYDRIVTELDAHDGCTTLALRRSLAAAAFRRTAEYDAAISAWMGRSEGHEFPEVLRTTFLLQRELRYGENPHQPAALYRDPGATGPSVATADVRHGKPLSYNNLNDAAAAVELVHDLRAVTSGRPVAAIIKHTNPCGAATGETLAAAFEAAYAGDPLAAFGGILALGDAVDAATVDAIVSGQRFLEVIVAPSFEPGTVERLGERWKNVRLLELGTLDGPPMPRELRSVPGGVLVQAPDASLPTGRDWRHVAGPTPDASTRADALFLWLVAKHLKSNAVCIGRDGALLGAGAGQMDRVASCRLAIEKAASAMAAAGSPPVAASDAFFPFPDGPELLIDAGVRCIVHPGGSKRDDETIELCARRDVTCLLTGTRHFRH